MHHGDIVNLIKVTPLLLPILVEWPSNGWTAIDEQRRLMKLMKLTKQEAERTVTLQDSGLSVALTVGAPSAELGAVPSGASASTLPSSAVRGGPPPSSALLNVRPQPQLGPAPLEPATVDQQNRRVIVEAQRRQDVVAETAVDDDVLKQDLPFSIEVAGRFQLLEGADFHAI